MADNLNVIRSGKKCSGILGRVHSDLEHARAILAAEIIRVLDEQNLSTRDAEKQTGVSHSDFSRIRNARLERFTLDRMMSILGKLDDGIEVKVTFRPRPQDASPVADDFRSLYHRAFREYGIRALWYVRELESPTPEDALVITRCLRVEGNMAARRLAEQIEKACHAAH